MNYSNWSLKLDTIKVLYILFIIIIKKLSTFTCKIVIHLPALNNYSRIVGLVFWTDLSIVFSSSLYYKSVVVNKAPSCFKISLELIVGKARSLVFCLLFKLFVNISIVIWYLSSKFCHYNLKILNSQNNIEHLWKIIRHGNLSFKDVK